MAFDFSQLDLDQFPAWKSFITQERESNDAATARKAPIIADIINRNAAALTDANYQWPLEDAQIMAGLSANRTLLLWLDLPQVKEHYNPEVLPLLEPLHHPNSPLLAQLGQQLSTQLLAAFPHAQRPKTRAHIPALRGINRENLSHYLAFADMEVSDQNLKLAELIRLHPPFYSEWKLEDAQIIMGLAIDGELNRLKQQAISDQSTQTRSVVSSLTMENSALFTKLANMVRTDLQKKAAAAQPSAPKATSTRQPPDYVPFYNEDEQRSRSRRPSFNCCPRFMDSKWGQTLWAGRNAGQKIAMYGGTLTSLGAMGAGLLIQFLPQHAGLLITAGTEMAKVLPGIIANATAFQTIPQAALAFYALAATLAAAALVLFIGASIYQIYQRRQQREESMRQILGRHVQGSV